MRKEKFHNSGKSAKTAAKLLALVLAVTMITPPLVRADAVGEAAEAVASPIADIVTLDGSETPLPEDNYAPAEVAVTPESTPMTEAESTPETVPDNTPVATPENTPEATPESTPEATPESTPEATPESTPEATPESTPEATPESTPEATPESTPEATPESTPEATPEPTPEEDKATVPTPTPIPEPTPTPEPTTEQTDTSRQVPIQLNVGTYTEPILYNKIDKDYAITKGTGKVNIMEEKSKNSRVVGTFEGGGLLFIIADKDQEWIFVESGDVRGFVHKDSILMNEEAKKHLDAVGEDKFKLATSTVDILENKAYTYSRDTIKDVDASSELRKSLLNYAVQFVGNPYVWGGTSLTNGADCSGYVMQLYRAFGYSLPRTSPQQSQYGTQIPVEDAQPGDLIFYQKEDGSIYHVVLYLGDGKAVHASDEDTGIIISNVSYSVAACAVRVIEDAEAEVILTGTENFQTTPNGEYLGRFKLTAYCNCEVCCGKWAGGPTASGAMPTQGTTIAVGGIDFGTKLNVGGQVFTVEDRGTPYGHIDIYMNDHEACRQFGVQYADVYVQN